jgi:hypothetical protein
MRLRFVLALTLGAATLWACGGGDNVGIDGGADATAGDGGGSDGAALDGGGGGDGAATDGAATDGAATDGGGGDGSSGTPFACGNKTCNSQTDYCQITTTSLDAGLSVDAGKKPDGGVVAVDTCMPYPAACTADGGSPSCSCIQSTCSCTQNGSDITVTCP